MFVKKILFTIILIFTILVSSVSADNTKILKSQLGLVNNIQYIDSKSDNSHTTQIVDVKLLTGDFKGEAIQLENILTGNPYYDINLKKGIKVILHAEDNGDGIEYYIEDIKRAGILGWLSILFCCLLIFVGKKKGIFSLVSIVFTILLISHVLRPLILLGLNPVLSTIIICILSTTVTMYLVGGINAKSTSATIGATMSLIFAGLLSFITMLAANLSGFSGENTMFLYSIHPELDFVALTISMMVLATLGAVMDVSMSIASTVNEIYLTDTTKSIKDLFISGMNVGRDIIGTMANTLILVYLGGSLTLVLLSENIDLQKFINLNQVVTEVASALIGSIAIVICVPFTAFVASLLIYNYAKKNEQEKIPWS